MTRSSQFSVLAAIFTPPNHIVTLDPIPGEMRTEEMAGAGTHRAPIDIHNSELWAFEYVNADEVELELLNLMRWVWARVKTAEDPIETAGIVHQRMVSAQPVS